MLVVSNPFSKSRVYLSKYHICWPHLKSVSSMNLSEVQPTKKKRKIHSHLQINNKNIGFSILKPQKLKPNNDNMLPNKTFPLSAHEKTSSPSAHHSITL